MKDYITIIGGGLAGSEAAYQIAKRGIKVKLYEMKPIKYSEAHSNKDLAEIVCSNSFKSNLLTNACGLLKEELRRLDSLLIKIADETSVPAGQALAVDREEFSRKVTEEIEKNPLIEVIHKEIENVESEDGIVIIATGPLTSEKLAKEIGKITGQDKLYFYDAAAPIISKDSIDFNIAYYKSRYDKGENEYINCPMNEEQFNVFYDELMEAEVVKPKDFEEKFFEGCMPFEEMARRGKQTLLFGPMKPVGLTKPDGTKPYAVVQLRQDNVQASLYNIVGFQTHLTWPEQRRVFSLIPGLENLKITRYGVMHRNSFISSPEVLEETYQSKQRKDCFFAGQLTGVEGYVESCASGLIAGINMAQYMQEKEPIRFGNTCIMGSQAYYITHCDPKHFQPMNANFGIVNLKEKCKKRERKEKIAQQALARIDEIEAML